MSRDYQKEYTALYKEYQQYTDNVSNAINDELEMMDFYDEYILKYKSKRDYVVDAMNKLVSEAAKENITIKERPVKYYKNKSDKKDRSEDMENIEERAVKTQEELQRLIDKDTRQQNSLAAKIDEHEKIIKQYQKEWEELNEDIQDSINLAKKNGWKVKVNRSEENADIEERALNTEKAYQKEIDKYKEKLAELEADMKKFYTDEAIEKHAESAVKSYKQRFIDDELKGKKQCQYDIDKYTKIINTLYSQAKEKGFKVNRSEENQDLETRKKSILADLTGLAERKNDILDSLEERAKSEADTQKYYDRLVDNVNNTQKQLVKLAGERSRLNREIKDLEDNYHGDIRLINKVINEAKSNNYSLKQRTVLGEAWLKD